MNNNDPVHVLSVNIAAPGRTIWLNNLGPSDAQDIARALSDSSMYANRPVDIWKAGELVLTFVNGISRHDTMYASEMVDGRWQRVLLDDLEAGHDPSFGFSPRDLDSLSVGLTD